MTDAFLEFNDVFVEEMGVLAQGSVKLSDSSVAFRNESTGKVLTAPVAELHAVEWARLATTPGLRFIFEAPDDDDHRTTQRTNLRIGGFKDKDQEKINKFIDTNWGKQVKNREHSLKGWNYGDARIKGPNLEFSVDGKLAFEVPLQNVNKCIAAKNEATLEFQDNDDAPVALTEMRFFMAEEEQGEDRVEAFRQMVLKYAGIETETGQAVATLEQILCMTPRGRYDIKVYPNHLSLHGKTYDYKIPTKSITRLFLVPHKDGRHMYFVISLNPPIRQGQTRYHYLVIEFVKDEHVDLELGMTQEQLNELYDKKLDREQSGNTYEIVSRIFRALVNMRITVPGNFVGHSGTPAIACAHKQASGFLYPLEKGLLYIHKPPMYVRFEEISSIHFARSDVSTRSFDFEIELKSGSTLVFNSVEKEEYNKLYDFIQNKGLRIRNAKKSGEKSATQRDRFAGSDDEHDAYAETVKAEGKEKMADSDDSSEDDSDYDLDKDLEKRRKLKEPDEFSGSEPDEEWDSDANSSDGSGGSSGAGSGSGSGSGSGDDDEGEERPKKKKKSEPKEKKEKKERKRKDDDGEKKSRKSKAKKDPNAPKRGMSAFMLWMGEARASIKKDGDSVGDVAKKAGELWKTIGADEKKKWEKKAAEDKERYEREMKEYKKSGGGSGGGGTSSGSGAAKKKTGSPQKSAKSKEFVDSSGSDSDDDDKPLKPKKETKVKKEESEESGSGDGSDSE